MTTKVSGGELYPVARSGVAVRDPIRRETAKIPGFIDVRAPKWAT